MSTDITSLQKQIESSTTITPDLVDALNNLAELQLATNPADAFNTAKRAAADARSIDYAMGEAAALQIAATCASAQRNYTEAEELYTQALKLRKMLHDERGLALVLARLGNLKLHTGKYEDALGYYNHSMDIRDRLNDELGVADLYANSGIIYGFQGNYLQALKSHMHALRLFEKLNDLQRIASATQNIGLIYTEQRNYEEAFKMLERALEIRRERKDVKAESDLLNNIGNVYFQQKKYDEAIKVHQQALKLRSEAGDKIKIATSLSNLADVYKAIGEYAQALDFYLESVELFNELKDARRLTLVYYSLGELYFILRQYNEAHTYLNMSIQLAEEAGLKDILSKGYEHLSQLYAHQEKYEEAYHSHRKYVALDKEISSIEVGKQMAQMTLRYEIEQKEREAELERIKNAELQEAYSSLEIEKKRSEQLLNNILPEEVSEELKQSGKTRARSFAEVTVMFADIKDFTGISTRLTAEEIVSGIDEYFELFDKIMDKYGIEKIKTIGDAYLCAAGVPVPLEGHAVKMIEAAAEFLQAAEQLQEKRLKENKPAFEFRIGVHTGPLVAGVVGIKKFAYDIWGDTVNTASRLQSNSLPNRINVSETTYLLIKDRFNCEYRGEIEAKHKGKLKMYFANP